MMAGVYFFQPTFSLADPHTDFVNAQLDSVENQFSSLKADGAQEEFNNPQPPASKDFAVVEPQPTPVAVAHVHSRVHTVELGSEVFYYRYAEPSAAVKIDGPMGGYYGNYTYRPRTPGVLNNPVVNAYFLQARYADSRHLTYTGSGIQKDGHDSVMELRGLIGKDYFIGADGRMTPYLGLGYRYLFDRGDGRITSTGALGYDRKSHYYYFPVGGNLSVATSKDWEMDFNLEYDFLLYGLQKSYFSDLTQFTGFNDPNIKSPQTSGYGLRGSVKFLKHGHLADFYIEPFLRYWSINNSKISTFPLDGDSFTGLEPKNNTIEVGSRFGVEF